MSSQRVVLVLAALLALVLAPAASAWPGLNGRVGLAQNPAPRTSGRSRATAPRRS